MSAEPVDNGVPERKLWPVGVPLPPPPDPGVHDEYDPGFDPWEVLQKDYRPPEYDEDQGDEGEIPNRLGVEDVAVIAARVDAAPPRKFLVRGIIISGSYGGFAAEDTSGKSLAALDLAVNVAAGGKWLDHYEVDDPGPVLMFLGEGDEDETIRRGRAVAGFYGRTFEHLPIRISHRVPKLTNELHIARVGIELEDHPARLVIIDPLYLAIGGVNTADLAEVGAALAPIQHACQEAGATLWIAHHWNKTGKGTGRHRATGTGFPQWARVVGSVNVAARITDGDASVVTLDWEIVGNSVADSTLRVRRRVWADDPADLGSPLHYELELLEDDDHDDDHSPAQRRTLNILQAAGEPLTVVQIGDRMKVDGTGMNVLRKRTIQDALNVLRGFGEAHDDDPPKGRPAHWSAGPKVTAP